MFKILISERKYNVNNECKYNQLIREYLDTDFVYEREMFNFVV